MAPSYTKTIICLANSRKTSGRCIAGIEFDGAKTGAWIRPVSARPTGELSEEERRFEDGKDPRLLDIIKIPMIEPIPHGFQTENHLIDQHYYWEPIGKGKWSNLQSALNDTRTPLWKNSSSSYNGLNDRVSQEDTTHLDNSLRLIKVEDLIISVAIEGANFGNGKRRVRGRFSLHGTEHLLAITDPIVERQYLVGPDGQFNIGHAILCISLGDLYEGYAYKLIAGVFLKS